MRNLRLLDIYRDSSKRVLDIFGFAGDETCGIFRVPSKVDGGELLCQASSDDDWDHVSISRGDRCPVWEEMEQIKRLFFRGTETAMQLHVPVAEHISFHGNCLHLWRPHTVMIPRPPPWMVGPTTDLERNALTGSKPDADA